MDALTTVGAIANAVQTLDFLSKILELSNAAELLGQNFPNVLTNLQNLMTVLVDSRRDLVNGTVIDNPSIKEIIVQLDLVSAEASNLASRIDVLGASRWYWERKRITGPQNEDEMSSIALKLQEMLSVYTAVQSTAHLPHPQTTLRNRLVAKRHHEKSNWLNDVLKTKRDELKETGTKKFGNLIFARGYPRIYPRILGTIIFQVTRSLQGYHHGDRYRRYLRYAFPSWISSSVIYLLWTSDRYGFPIDLRVTQTRSYNDKIWQLVKAGNVDDLRNELERSQVSPYVEDPSGRSLLWHAVSFKTLDICAFLLQIGADPLLTSPFTGESPIVAAWNLVINAGRRENTQAARMTELFRNFAQLTNDLIQISLKSRKKGAPSWQDPSDEDTDTKLFDVLMDGDDDLGTDQAPVAYETDPFLPVREYFENSAPVENLTPSATIGSGKLDIKDPTTSSVIADTQLVKQLILAGTNLRESDERGWTALHFAASEGDVEGAKSLLDGASKAHYEREPLMHALAPMLELDLLNARDNGGRSPLTIAIRSQQPVVALFLIEKGAAVDMRDYYGKSPIFHAILFNDEKAVGALLGKDCDLSFVGRDGCTILHTTAQSATTSIIRKLQEHMLQRPLPHSKVSLVSGPPIANARNEEGRTAMEYLDRGDETRANEFERLINELEIEQYWDAYFRQYQRRFTLTTALNLIFLLGITLLYVELRVSLKRSSELEFWMESLLELRAGLTRPFEFEFWIDSRLVYIWLPPLAGFYFVFIVYMLLIDRRARPAILFSWHRVSGAGLRFLRTPASTGTTRVSWVCKCGRYLEDDYVELIPGAAAEFERQVRLLSNSGVMQNIETERDIKLMSHPRRSSPRIVAPSGQVQPTLQNPATPSLAGTSASNGLPQPPPYTNNQQQISLPPNSQPTQSRPPQQSRPPPVTHAGPKWLLVCSRPHKLPTSLSQLDFADVHHDKAMFRNIQKAYHSKKSSWHSLFSMLGVVTIRFVRFSMITHFVDIHPPIPDLPPVNRQSEYIYDRGLNPPVGENLMTHFFYHPEHASFSFEVGRRSPKRRLRVPTGTATPVTQDGLYWGISLVEGVLWERMCWLLLSVFGGGSLIFAIVWVALRKDVSAAFAVSAWMVTLAALITGLVQYKVN